METSIYIGNEKMQMVCGTRKAGRLEIDTFTQVRLPEGAVLNGVITSEELFTVAFEELMKDRPDIKDRCIHLIIGGDQILTKTSLAPKISEKEMLEWIKGEFDDTEFKEEMLFDYRLIDRRIDGDLALICAAQKDMIGAYVDLLEEMGTEIESISTGIDSQIRLLNFLPETTDDSFIFLVLDGNSLYASIYVDGIFRLSNWSRIFSERGTPEMSGEVERMVSNLQQFSYTEGYADQLKKTYICGCHKEEIFIFKNIAERFSIATDILRDKDGVIVTDGGKFRLDEYVYAIGTLL